MVNWFYFECSCLEWIILLYLFRILVCFFDVGYLIKGYLQLCFKELFYSGLFVFYYLFKDLVQVFVIRLQKSKECINFFFLNVQNDLLKKLVYKLNLLRGIQEGNIMV